MFVVGKIDLDVRKKGPIVLPSPPSPLLSQILKIYTHMTMAKTNMVNNLGRDPEPPDSPCGPLLPPRPPIHPTSTPGRSKEVESILSRLKTRTTQQSYPHLDRIVRTTTHHTTIRQHTNGHHIVRMPRQRQHTTTEQQIPHLD